VSPLSAELPLTATVQQLDEARARSPVNLRSISLGLIGVIAICSLVPYNDLAVNNTPMIGNYLPIGLLLFFLTVILLINAPLHRFAPRHAFTTSELAVSISMLMVGCSVPATGLMRYLPAALIGTFYHAGANSDYAAVLRKLDLPDWIFPTMPGYDPLARASDPVVQNYYNRAGGTADTLIAHLAAVPWAAWIKPIFIWAIFIFAFWGAILCCAVIVRKQWIENERLPFPIAQVYLSLIEEPAKGRSFNALFRSPLFYFAACSVFAIHFFNSMNQYDARHWPRIPIEYNLSSVLTESPWIYTEPEGTQGNLMGFKHNVIFFSIVGITFFLQTRTAFSLWFFYIFLQVERVIWSAQQAEFGYPQQQDQQVGAIIPFAIAILWVGRKRWAEVLRAMTRRLNHSSASAWRYLPDGLAGWGLVLFVLIMIGWLIAAGCSIIGAIVLVTLILTVMLVTARVIAETGLLFLQLGFPYSRPWILAMTPPLGLRTTGRSFFFHGLLSMILGHDVRETLSTFSTHALKVEDETRKNDDRGNQSPANEKHAPHLSLTPSHIRHAPTQRPGLSFLLTLALTLVIAYAVSFASMLHVEYTHGVTLDTTQQTPLNPWGTEWGVKSYMFAPAQAYLPPRNGPSEVHSRWAHFSFGLGAVSVLSFLRLRLAWWPLHPVGLLTCYGWPIKQIWFSIFIGWLLKLLVVRFGGINLFRSAKHFFIGLIIGEATAAGFWMLVSLVLSTTGADFHAVRLFPN
jgi:uncharacterized membrane protein YidH (DUF202 family)